MSVVGFELEVIEECYAFLDNSWRRKNVCDPFTRLYYVKKGEGYLTHAGHEIKMTAGNVYMVPAGVNFEYCCGEDNTMEKIYFHISILTFEKYDLLSQSKGIYELPIKSVGCEEIFELYNEENYISMFKIKSMLYQTVVGFFEKFSLNTVPYKEYSPLVKNTMKYIRNKTLISLNVAEIAREMHVSPSKLRNEFKTETGVTIGEYIDELVFYRAKRLLKKDLSIKEISERLRFCDQFYFSRRFKEKYGITPTEYRKEMLI